MATRARGLGALTAAVVAIALTSHGSEAAPGQVDTQRAGAKTKVGCWKDSFPFESGGPSFFAKPRKCLWYRRRADTYAEGALLGKALEWEWRRRHATAAGRLKLPGTGLPFAKGVVRLQKPVESCGRVVFGRLKYRVRSDNRWHKGGYPIYTCRSHAKQQP